MNVLTATNVHDCGYHDSYFYSIYVDTESKRLHKHMTHTTAGAGFNPVKVETKPIDKLTVDEKATFDDACQVIVKELISESNIFYKGDIVRVVKGRKYPKGFTFTVTGRSVWKDRYGRVQTRYLVGDDDIKVNIENCELVNRGFDEEHLAFVVASVTRYKDADRALSWYCPY